MSEPASRQVHHYPKEIKVSYCYLGAMESGEVESKQERQPKRKQEERADEARPSQVHKRIPRDEYWPRCLEDFFVSWSGGPFNNRISQLSIDVTIMPAWQIFSPQKNAKGLLVTRKQCSTLSFLFHCAKWSFPCWLVYYYGQRWRLLPVSGQSMLMLE